ncbi:hypothetical protein ACFWG6_24285 [Streptomyces erythrochromogenes]|uniref:hypothetical protein n=1 Tax=Streptomyces erythrochromogenes TaxID=285574 RepID=UPI00364026C7
MDFTRFRRPSACLLLATTVGLGCTVVAAVEAGSDGGLVLLHGLQDTSCCWAGRPWPR